jgi:hypothetical protein
MSAELDRVEAELAERRRRLEELVPVQEELDGAFERVLAGLVEPAAHFQSELLGPETAVGTRWVAQRDRSLVEAEDVLRERTQALDEREQELEARQLRAGVDLQVRKDELDRREGEREALAAPVERRDAELSAYVAQLQALQRRSG